MHRVTRATNWLKQSKQERKQADLLRWVQTIIDRVEYKGWQFIVTEREPGTITLTMRGSLQDSDNPDRVIEVSSTIAVSGKTLDGRDGNLLLRLTQQMIEGMELHEVREWFCFDGIRVSNPHLSPNSR